MTAEVNTFVITGNAAGLARGYTLNAETGVFGPARGTKGYYIQAEAGLFYPFIETQVGNFIVEGYDANLVYTKSGGTTPPDTQPPTQTTPSVDPNVIPGGRIGTGPGGGGGYGNRSIDDIYTDRKLRQNHKKRATISKQDDEEIMTVISAFLRMVDDEEDS
jgi:hypothetical protein